VKSLPLKPNRRKTYILIDLNSKISFGTLITDVSIAPSTGSYHFRLKGTDTRGYTDKANCIAEYTPENLNKIDTYKEFLAELRIVKKNIKESRNKIYTLEGKDRSLSYTQIYDLLETLSYLGGKGYVKKCKEFFKNNKYLSTEQLDKLRKIESQALSAVE